MPGWGGLRGGEPRRGERGCLPCGRARYGFVVSMVFARRVRVKNEPDTARRVVYIGAGDAGYWCVPVDRGANSRSPRTAKKTNRRLFEPGAFQLLLEATSRVATPLAAAIRRRVDHRRGFFLAAPPLSFARGCAPHGGPGVETPGRGSGGSQPPACGAVRGLAGSWPGNRGPAPG